MQISPIFCVHKMAADAPPDVTSPTFRTYLPLRASGLLLSFEIVIVDNGNYHYTVKHYLHTEIVKQNLKLPHRSRLPVLRSHRHMSMHYTILGGE